MVGTTPTRWPRALAALEVARISLTRSTINMAVSPVLSPAQNLSKNFGAIR
jgi:hypothetical protein